MHAIEFLAGEDEASRCYFVVFDEVEDLEVYFRRKVGELKSRVL
jgi:hypothetical protein